MELNEKLARWRWPNAKDISVISDTNGVWLIHVWEAPSKVHVMSPFTSSLDACFKWLVPKLDHVSLVSNLNMLSFYVLVKKGKGNWADAEGYTPALALCCAISNLIDKED